MISGPTTRFPMPTSQPSSSREMPVSTAPGQTARRFEEGFVQAGKFTAGMAAHYDGSGLSDGTKTGDKSCKNVVVGMRLPSAQIVRFSDSKPIQIQSLCALNGKWRLFAFGEHVRKPEDLRTINQVRSTLLYDRARHMLT